MTYFIRTALFAVVGMGLAAGQTATRPEFEVASVKASKRPKEAGTTNVTPQGINYSGVSLRMILAEAYSVKWPSMSSPDSRIRAMLDEGTYDIVAKADHAVPKDRLMLMLQSLLAERFKLALHIESKVEPVYKLVIAKEGVKLRESSVPGDPGVNGIPSGAGLDCRNMTMSLFSRYLTSRMGRVVLDQTGLTGQYDFVLKIGGLPSIEEARNAVAPNASPDVVKSTVAAILNDWSLSSIFSDIQQQLGLRLEADRAPVDNLVVDHVEKPSEN